MHVPGVLVDAVVVAPDQMQTTQTFYDPALSGEVHRGLDDIEPVEFGLEKVIARRAAAELQVDATVNLGFGISAAVPRVLLEEGHAEDVTWVIEQGAVGGFPLTGFAFGCALNPQALVQSVDQFTLLQGGGFDVAMLSFLEVSAAGDVNVSYLPARPHVTAGVGGFNDIITRAPKIVYSGYFTAGKKDIRIEDGRAQHHHRRRGRQVRARGRPDLVLRRDGAQAPPGGPLRHRALRHRSSSRGRADRRSRSRPASTSSTTSSPRPTCRCWSAPTCAPCQPRCSDPEPMGLTLARKPSRIAQHLQHTALA